MDDSDSRIQYKELSEYIDYIDCIDPDVQKIIACLQRTNRLTDNAIKCLDKCSESTRKEILFCLLLNELEKIQNRTLSCETDSCLACGQFVPGNIKTIATDREGNIVDTPTATKHSQLGQLFAASDGTNIGFLQSRKLQITNPANSGRVLHIERVVGGAFFGDAYEVVLLQNANPLTDPEPRTIVNRNWSSTNTSSATANANTTPALAVTGGLRLQNTIHAIGYFELEFKGELVIPSAATDQTFTVQVNNLSQSLIGVDLTIVWSETA